MTEKLSSEEYAARVYALEENLKLVREKIAEAALKAGRDEKEITLLAATKTVPPELINAAIRLGVNCIGENRVQELLSKYDALSLSSCDCHFIGHLQTNKVRQLLGKVNMIESVGSLHLAEEVSRLCVLQKLETPILAEVNIGREEQKSGFLPEELPEALEKLENLPGIVLSGLMTVPPAAEHPCDSEHYFSEMYQYYVDITEKKSDNRKRTMSVLSMGMSADYPEAIRCGANLVRVGSALFGKRIYP